MLALSKTDAYFVDVIHTDAGLYGAPVTSGTVDFWPNGGDTLQPGCPSRNFKPLTDNGMFLVISVDCTELQGLHRQYLRARIDINANRWRHYIRQSTSAFKLADWI